MGWLYMTNLKGHKTPKAYLDDQFTFAGEHADLRVLRSALVHMKRYYVAVERTDENGKRHVFAVVCLVNYNLRAKEGFIFGYKDMDESMGPCETDCPAAILDLLTETNSEWAKQWRERCRKRLQKKDAGCRRNDCASGTAKIHRWRCAVSLPHRGAPGLRTEEAALSV
jgi:hypothetical protein